MSQLAELQLNRLKTVTGHPTAITWGGTSGTDYQAVSLTPIGIDRNGVAKFRSALTGTQVNADALTLTVSQTTPANENGKAVSKMIITLPTVVTENGVSVRRNIKAFVQFDTYNSNTALQVDDLLCSTFHMLKLLSTDIIGRTPLY